MVAPQLKFTSVPYGIFLACFFLPSIILIKTTGIRTYGCLPVKLYMFTPSSKLNISISFKGVIQLPYIIELEKYCELSYSFIFIN